MVGAKSQIDAAEQFYDDNSSEIASEIFVDIAKNQQLYIDRLAKDKCLAEETAMEIYE